MLGFGEMGIANTTAASAVVAALLKVPPIQVTGRGTGLKDKALSHKIGVIEKALAAAGATKRRRIGLVLPPRSLPGIADSLGKPWIAHGVATMPGVRLLAPHAVWIVGEKS